MMTNKNLIFVMLVMVFITISCSSDDDGPATAPITVNAQNMEALQGTAQYRAWIRTGGNDVALGTFQDANFPKTFTALADDLANASEFFITIEASGDTQTPSDTKIANALFSGTSNRAQINSEQAIGNFTGISGSFVLRTFTDTSPNNDPNGIWFTNSLNSNVTSGLSLPDLPNGWEYESWMVIQDRNGADVNVSLGKFTTADQRDSSDIFSGQNDGPSIPGEDFLNQAAGNLINVEVPVNLVGKRGFITIEPTTADNSNEPFFIEILSFSSAVANEVNTMNTNNFFITGSVEREVNQ